MSNEITLSYLRDDYELDVMVSVQYVLNADNPWTSLIEPYLSFLVSTGFIIDHKIIEALVDKVEELFNSTYNPLQTNLKDIPKT